MKTRLADIGALILAIGLAAGCAPILPPIMESSDGKGTLHERVSALYPVGSKSQDLTKELKQQGFSINLRSERDLKTRQENGSFYQASKKLPGSLFPCVAMIDWRSDIQDNIMAYQTVAIGCAGP